MSKYVVFAPHVDEWGITSAFERHEVEAINPKEAITKLIYDYYSGFASDVEGEWVVVDGSEERRAYVSKKDAFDVEFI